MYNIRGTTDNINHDDIALSIDRFLCWMEAFGDQSYDQFDYWATKIGEFGKALFLRNKILAAPIVLPIQMLESFFPGLRMFFASKRRYAIGDAHFALGFINLYEHCGEIKYLEAAKARLLELEKYSTRTSSGVGWGYPYTWHTQYHTFTPGEPVITVTPYVFFAYAKMYSITKENDCLRMLNDILDFVRYDIIDTDIDPDTKASSYGPNDSSMVINAVAYRAATLCEAYKIFPESDIIELAQKNINFVLSSQNKDGSWLYANDSRFIDNFHTSFVMNKLLKCYCVIGDEKILDSIKRGYNFYLNNFFRSNGTQIHFYKTRFPKFRYIETYDYAEAITLGVQLKDYVNESFQVAQNLARFLVSNLQTPDGYFVTRVSILRTKNKIPYLRWPQAQLFYSLTNLLQELD